MVLRTGYRVDCESLVGSSIKNGKPLCVDKLLNLADRKDIARPDRLQRGGVRGNRHNHSALVGVIERNPSRISAISERYLSVSVVNLLICTSERIKLAPQRELRRPLNSRD